MGNIILLDEIEKLDSWGTPSTLKVPGENNKLLLQGVYPFRLPEIPKNEKDILFYNCKREDQYWQRQGPPQNWKSLSAARREKWIEEETDRCFITGKWMFSDGEPVWLPPAFYFTLNWWYSKVGYMNFRYCQLLEEYYELFCEADRWCISTFRLKKRRDGLTTRRMARKIWKAIQTREGWFGLQSKTGKDAKTVCWNILMRGYKKLPLFFLPEASGMTDPKTSLEFKRPSERISKTNQKTVYDINDIFRQGDIEDLNTTVDWRDTVSDAYDGQQIVELTLDEWCKWKKASALDALYTCKRSAQLDGIKVGMIHCISSPPETDGPNLDDTEDLWNESNYEEIKNDQTFKVYRWLTSSLDSYAGAINKFGVCDRDLAESMIDAERDAAPKRKRKAVVRQTIKYIDEIFDATDDTVFLTAPEMRVREKFLKGIRFKDAAQKEPKYIYGNFAWEDGVPFSTVVFKPSEDQEDFSFTGRWAIMKFPTKNGSGNTWREKMAKGKIVKLPPVDSEYTLGVDPYDFKRVADTERASLGAGMIGKCFDFHGLGDANDICALSNYRPPDPSIFYADMLMGAIFYGAWVNSEARNIKIFDYFEENGYYEYMLPKDISNPKKKDLKGSPTTNPMIQEICSLTEAFASTYLNQVWHEAIPADWLKFNPQLTKKSNITMAGGHMFIGMAKMRRLYRKKKNATHDERREFSETLADCLFG